MQIIRHMPSRLMILLMLMFSGVAVAKPPAPSCETKNLIDFQTAPIRDQMFGRDGDIGTGWCFAFAIANAAGQVFGTSIAPEDIALQYYFMRGKVPFKTNSVWQATTEGRYRDYMVPSEAPATKLFSFGSDTDVVGQMMARVGYCPTSRYQQPLSGDWYQGLRDSAKALTAGELINGLNQMCSPRLEMSKDILFKWNDVSWTGNLVAARRAGIVLIDKKLREGKRIVTSLYVGFSSHVVVIQGVTKDCRYIVQNSNILYDQPAVIHPDYNDEHIQLWDRKVIEDKLSGFGYFEEESAKPWYSIF